MSKGFGQLNSLELIQAFFGQFEKKLKPQENNSELKQKNLKISAKFGKMPTLNVTKVQA